MLLQTMHGVICDAIAWFLWLSGNACCALSAHALGQGWPAQPSPMPGFGYQPTIQDVDPGIDHGNFITSGRPARSLNYLRASSSVPSYAHFPSDLATIQWLNISLSTQPDAALRRFRLALSAHPDWCSLSTWL